MMRVNTVTTDLTEERDKQNNRVKTGSKSSSSQNKNTK
jgi:hypothetical protein